MRQVLWVFNHEQVWEGEFTLERFREGGLLENTDHFTGSSCSKPDKANPGLVESLIEIYLRLMEDFHKIKVQGEENCNL